jgi:hypothetical protein
MEAGMRAPTQTRPEFADGSRRSFRWTRLPWAVCFVVASTLTWWATYRHHAAIGVGVLIIIILVSLSVYSLYKTAEGNAQAVSAFAGIVVLSMALAVIQKAPSRHPGEVLTQKWAPCPASRNPMAGYAPVHAEPVRAGLPASYGIAHIDSVIAPDGTAHVTRQELDCVTITGGPAPGRTLWLVSRIEPTPVPPQQPYKLFFAIAALSNPQRGQYSVRYTRWCSSAPSGSVHVLMVVSADPQQNRALWRNYNENHTGNCDKGVAYDASRRVRTGSVISNQLAVTDK